MLNEWTVQYYFNYLGHEVLYRRTPEGPEVVAVGYDEIDAVRQGMLPRDQLQYQTWMS